MKRLETQKQSTTADKLTVVCAALAVVAAGCSASVAYMQYRSALVDRRAWISVEGFDLSTLEIGKMIGVTVHVKNTGRVPAGGQRVDSRAYWVVRKYGESDYDFGMRAEALHKEENSVPIAISSTGPESIAHLAVTNGELLLKDELTDMTNGMVRSYIVGKITYDDGLPTRGKTNFCVYVGFERSSGAIETRPCYTRNEMY